MNSLRKRGDVSMKKPKSLMSFWDIPKQSKLKTSFWDVPKFNTTDFDKKGKKVRTKISISLTKDLFIRAKGKCEKCTRPLKGLTPHIHHKDRNPSNNKPSNLLVICPNCHSKIHKKDTTKTLSLKRKIPKGNDFFKMLGG